MMFRNVPRRQRILLALLYWVSKPHWELYWRTCWGPLVLPFQISQFIPSKLRGKFQTSKSNGNSKLLRFPSCFPEHIVLCPSIAGMILWVCTTLGPIRFLIGRVARISGIWNKIYSIGSREVGIPSLRKAVRSNCNCQYPYAEETKQQL